jgi:hypothetical protein
MCDASFAFLNVLDVVSGIIFDEVYKIPPKVSLL